MIFKLRLRIWHILVQCWMKVMKSGALSIATFFWCATTILVSVANAHPRACSDRDYHKLPDKPTDHSDPLIVRNVDLLYGQKKYSVRTYSDTAVYDDTRNEQCLRYEVENRSKGNVRQIYWKTAGLRIDPLRPGRNNRVSLTHTLPLLEDPIKSTSTIYAFENTHGKTRAWKVRDDEPHASTGSLHRNSFSQLAPDKIQSGLSSFLRENSLPSQKFVAFSVSNFEANSSIWSRFSSAFGSISFISIVRRDGPNVMMSYDIKSSASQEIKYTAPALQAIGQIKLPISNFFETYRKFISDFRRFSLDPKKFTGNVFDEFDIKPPAADLRENRVYKISHPVTIESEDAKFCFLAQSFAPIAVKFSMRDCPNQN